jgi:hypothetical protein
VYLGRTLITFAGCWAEARGGIGVTGPPAVSDCFFFGVECDCGIPGGYGSLEPATKNGETAGSIQTEELLEVVGRWVGTVEGDICRRWIKGAE